MTVLVGAVSAMLIGCGTSETTTVIREAPTTIERTTTVEAPAQQPRNRPAKPPQQASPPNVVGLPLDVAEELLEEADYRVAAKNTDTAFGIVVPSNYTVCTQSAARGDVVPVLAQKYGC
ncbi:MAG TPA: PASTA domain-containing protein [Solirubrobacterales bacterium]|nr:PASTA domain-containing protein [Solirubrobacterales bacterium]